VKIYENIIIGNFLYALGVSIGKATANTRHFSVINLMQQTPDDKLLGDLLVEFPGVVKLIEFKNRKSSKKKEKDKIRQLKIALNNNIEMLKISNSVHWYIETDPLEKVCFNKIVPYINACESTASNYTLESFIHGVTEEVTSHNELHGREKIKTYLQVVAGCQGTTDRSSGSGDIGTSSGGLLLCIDNAELTFVQYTDTLQLQLQHKEFVKLLANELTSIMRPEIDKNKDRRMTLDLKNEEGLSL